MKDIKNISKNNRGEDEPMIQDDEDYYKGGYQVVLHEDKRYYPEAE